MKNQIIPIEVKSGTGRTLKSMNLFLNSHPSSPYGIKFSTNNFSIFENIQNYPLYAIAEKLIEARGNRDSFYLAIMSLL